MKQSLFRLLALMGFASGIAWLSSPFLGTFLAILLGMVFLAGPLVYFYVQLEKLHKISILDTTTAIPKALGVWGEAFSRLERTVKDARLHIASTEARHERFILGFQASPNGVVMLDEDLNIDWCNASAENFFGISLRLDHQKNISHLVRQTEFMNYLSARRFEHPIVIQRMGFAQDLALTLQVFPFGEDQLLLLAQDITDSQKTDAMRRDFIANVSHEIRTPLTVLMGFLETMQSIDLPADQRHRYINLMMTQTARMKSLVEDLLMLANLEASATFASLNAYDVSFEMAQLKIDAEALSKGKHRLIFNIQPDLDLLGERRELQSAFSNLVANAIRYTPEGGEIKISWGLSATRHGVFSVTDTGLGIEAIHLPRLTERFYRVDGSRSRDTGGTGLGLAIVKHIATRHHAQLLISSKVGQGSTFTLRFSPERLTEGSDS